MKGYRDPPPAFIDEISENGQKIEVVTNRKLKGLISELIEDAASEEMPKAGQAPEFILESVNAYVGRVERVKLEMNSFRGDGIDLSDLLGGIRGKLGSIFHGVDGPPPPQSADARPDRSRVATQSVAGLAREAIEIASQSQSAQAAADVVRQAKYGTGISDAIDLYSAQAPVDHFETQTGFAVTGAGVVRATSPRIPAELLGSHLVRLHPAAVDVPSASLLIEFDGGTGTVLPALRGYVGHIFVNDGSVTNVNYVPSANSTRWNDYQYVRERVEALRAAVAAAAGLGVFRIAPQEAQAFADKIRELKVFDPALGLYAAYAYASAGIESEVESVLKYMRYDLAAELFDVAVLARRDVRPRETGVDEPDGLPILPFCPMLRQGWSWLAVRGAQLPDAAREARNWLLPALWTTFAPEGVKLLREAMARGDFK